MTPAAARTDGASSGGLRMELLLFVADSEPNSQLARRNLQRVLDSEPSFSFDLQIFDVLEDYQTALDHRVLVTPCLLLVRPQPRVMLVGTLSDEEKVRAALRLGTERAPHV